ncbi:helix-turn-helix transcriptional regulator [Streptomyces sp. NRRL WC-3742]|uniref:helix-turn-helix transcriptional regulator n=1 Tax=Streptomyces sp. NRRL WC-3742 TaxID=1463934 RepID=UPI00131B9F6B|nr:LuxR family transcriptional regulator [Streptomyces sp. NRRL WC-3742]
MALIEMGDALVTLSDIFSEIKDRRGRTVVVSGSLASGGTELLHSFCEQVQESEALLLTATGSYSERMVRLGALSQLVHHAPLPAEVLRRLAEAVAEQPRGEADTPSDVAPRRETGIIQEVCDAVLKLAEQRRVVLAVEDLHFVDQASLRALLYLRLRMRATCSLLVLTEWTESFTTPLSLRVELTRMPHQRITLDSLSTSGVARHLSGALGARTAARMAGTYHRLTAGNPMLVDALLEDNSTADENATALPVVGPAFERAVLTCLHRWELGLVDIARGVAVLGSHASPHLIGRLLNSPPDGVARGLTVLAEAGLLEEGRFRHPAVAALVLKNVPPEEAGGLHSRAAELLYENGAAAGDVAHHLIALDDVPGPWAVTLLREVAKEALVVADDARLATQCLGLALRHCADGPQRISVAAELAMARWRTNPSAAIRLTPLQNVLGERELTDRDAAMVVRNLLWRGDHDQAVNALDRLHGSTTAPDPQAAAELDLTYLWIYGPRLVRPGRLDAEAVRSAAAADSDPWSRAAALLYASLHDWQRDDLVESSWHLLSSSRLSETSLGVLASTLLCLTYADELECAASWCDSLMAEAGRRRAPAWQAMLGCVRADLALRRGKPALASSCARDALEQATTQSWGLLAGYAISTLVLSATATGAYEEAEVLLQTTSPGNLYETVFGLRYLHARGHFYLETNRVLAAFSDFQKCGNLTRQWGIDIPAIVPWRADLAQAHLRLGHQDKARELVNEQLERPGAIGTRLRGTSLRVLAASSPQPDKVPLLRDAVRLLRASGDLLEAARATADLANAYLAAGETGRARRVAQRAQEEAESCQIPALVTDLLDYGPERPAEPEPPRPAAEPAHPTVDTRFSDLSDAELRVAAQAALGYTNREIGMRLFITPSTVEQHLTRVYRKLRVNGRRNLPLELLRTAADDTPRTPVPAVAGATPAQRQAV